MANLGGIKVQRHHETDHESEESIRALLESQYLPHYSWSNQGGDHYSAHSHSYTKIIWVIRGEITFILPEFAEELRLGLGDRMELPADVVHEARVGRMGVTCLETHL